MRTIQFREAVCEAMSEEMRRDESIYLMGEEVAEYNGAYKASKEMLDKFGPKRVIDTLYSRRRFRRYFSRSCYEWLPSYSRVYDLQLFACSY